MKKKRLINTFRPLLKLISTFPEFTTFLFSYLKKKTLGFSISFESKKDILVKFFMMKRGRYNRPFLHFATMGALTIGVIIAPFLANTYPVFSQNSSTSAQIESASQEQSIIVGENVFQTQVSQKPRDRIIAYTIQKGDTLSTIGDKFGVSQETIKWQNDLTSDNLTVGDVLEILPVSGLAYKVQSGDTVYTVAKKFDTSPQKIVDFPFNDFANPETFSLVSGQILIVPDGIKPSQRQYYKPQTILASAPTSVSSGGFIWPAQGSVSQFASWYHNAVDVAGSYGTPVYAAKGGTVTSTNVGGWNYGYGNSIVVDHGDGFSTLYAHLDKVNASPGQSVSTGAYIGTIGMTGRTTGPHVHFEVIRNGVNVNPLSFLR